MATKMFLDKYDITLKKLKEEHEFLKEEHEILKEEHEILKEEHETLKKKSVELNNLLNQILTYMESKLNINTNDELKRKFENESAFIVTNNIKRVKVQDILTNTTDNKYDNISDNED